MMINDEVDEAWAAMRPPPPPPPGTPPQPTARRNPIPARSLALDNTMIPHPHRSLAPDRNPSNPGKSRSGMDVNPSLSDTADSTFSSTKSTSTNSSSSLNLSIVDKRRRLALAIYESERRRSDKSKAPSKEEDEAWDPILMDRLSPTGDTESDFSFSEPPWTESESTEGSEKAPPKPQKRNPLSPVSEFRSHFSPRNQVPPKNKNSPTRQPMSPLSEFRNLVSPKSELTPRTAAIEGEKELLRHHKSLFDSFSVATSVTPSVDSRMNSVFSTASAAQSSPTRRLSVSTSARPMPFPTPVVLASPDADSLAYSAATTRAASISPSVLAAAPEMPSPLESPHKLPGNRRKSTDNENELQSTPEKSPFDTTTPEKGKRKTFFKKILGRRGKEKSALMSPGGSNDNPTTPVKSRRKSASGDKPITTPKLSRRKKKSPEKIGRPQNVQPGQSYKSTPHSAEIVVRRSVEPDPSSADIENLSQLPSREAPTDGSTSSDSRVDLSTSIDENAQLDIDESCSSPRFESIEEDRETFSSSRREDSFKHYSTFSPSHDDGVSAMTEPSYNDGSGEKRAREFAERRTKRLEKGDNVGSDPLGRYWDESENKQVHPLRSYGTVDPFASPFFETQATSSLSSKVTTPASSHSHSVDAIEEMRSLSHGTKNDDKVHKTQTESLAQPEDTPDDGISGIQIHVAERIRQLAEREKMIALQNQLDRMRVQKPVDSAPSTGVPVTGAKTVVHQPSPVRAKKSIDPAPLTGSPLTEAEKFAYQSNPVRVQEHVDSAPLTTVPVTGAKTVVHQTSPVRAKKSIDPAPLTGSHLTEAKKFVYQSNPVRVQKPVDSERSTTVPVIGAKTVVHQTSPVRAKKSIDPAPLTGSLLIGEKKVAYQSNSVRVPKSLDQTQLTGVSMTPSQIVEKRIEIAERRKHIEAKLSAVGVTPVNTSMEEEDVEEKPLKSPGSRISGKAFAYLRALKKEHESSTRSQQDSTAIPGDVDPPCLASTRPRSLDQHDVSIASPNNELAAKSLLDRFQGRKPRAPYDSIQVSLTMKPSLDSSRAATPTPSVLAKVRKSRKGDTKPQNEMAMFSKKTPYVPTPREVNITTVSRGIAIKSRKRQQLIMAGDVVIARRPPKRTPPPEIHTMSHELDMARIKDPIKRAGLRVLSKSAIPIQSEIRRFLAHRNAVDRLWALVELQSYFRRWKCEAFLLANVYSASRIQAAFRGWQTRDTLAGEEQCITRIQAIVRGYLASLNAYEKLHHIITLQAVARGMLARKKVRQVVGKVVLIQKCLRGFTARIEVATWHVAATIIQAGLKGYLAQLHYQFDMVDIIIVQSVVRRWLVLRWTQRKRNHMLRKKRQEQEEIENDAACQIQAAWRGFHAYSMFIFVLADILIMQRTVRGWLAARQVKSIQQERGATKIQTLWRGHKARVVMLYRLVHIIIVQSVIRQHLARRKALRERYLNTPTCHASAAHIQAAWRGYWQFSNYLIIRFYLVRAQAAVRGHIVRRNAQLRLGCIIILQATMRGYLDRQRFAQMKTIDFIVASKAVALRERIASKRVQMFLTDAVQKRKEKEQGFGQTTMTDFIVASRAVALRERIASKRVQMFLTDAVQKRKEKEKVVASGAVALRERIASKRVQIFLTDAVQKRKEKVAALKIEGFFLMVKREVDREVLRYQKKRSSRSSRQGKSEGDSNGWLNDGSRTLTLTDPGYNRSMARYRDQRPEVRISDVRPALAVRVDHTDDVSILTVPSVFKRQTAPSRRAYTRRDLGRDPILEEAWIDEERKQRQVEQEYMQRHGIQEQGSRRWPSHSPYDGPPPVDHRRMQVGLRTPQFSEAFAPMPSHHEKHHWPAPSDHRYRPRPEQSSRPTSNPRHHYHGHHSSGYGRECERSYESDERPPVYNRYGEPRDHGSYSTGSDQQGIQRVSTNAPQYHQQGAPRDPSRAPHYHQQRAPPILTSAPQCHRTPRVSNPPRRLEIDSYEEFVQNPDVRKRMV